MLDVADVDAAVAQDVKLGVAEVVADGADDADLVEEGGGQREVHGGAAEHPLALAERCLDRVKRDRSDHCHRHRGAYPTVRRAVVQSACTEAAGGAAGGALGGVPGPPEWPDE